MFSPDMMVSFLATSFLIKKCNCSGVAGDSCNSRFVIVTVSSLIGVAVKYEPMWIIYFEKMRLPP